jgi:hypothetical protein
MLEDLDYHTQIKSYSLVTSLMMNKFLWNLKKNKINHQIIHGVLQKQQIVNFVN